MKKNKMNVWCKMLLMDSPKKVKYIDVLYSPVPDAAPPSQ